MAEATGSSAQPEELSRTGAVLFSSLERRMFGDAVSPTLGRYHLLEVLGKGAMGVVYKAYDPKLDRSVAIKVLSLGGDKVRQRMVREAKSLAKLNHPNVVTIHEVGEEGEQLYVVMEYVDGGTLSRYAEALRKGPRATERILELAQQAAEGVAAAHALGLVHRDLKPANILIGRDGRLRIADFGLASGVEPKGASVDLSRSVADLDSATLTEEGQLVGTPAFMAPEQFVGVADARSDQFSLAVSLFIAFYGQAPFRGPTLFAVLEAINQGRVEKPSVRGVPDYVRSVLLRALAADPEERFPDVRAMARALRQRQRRRRARLGLAGLGVASGAVAASVWALQPKACTDERGRIATVVEQHGARISGLISTSGRPKPEEVSGRLQRELDALVDRWAEQRLAACRGIRSAEPDVAALGQQQLACLEQGLSSAETLLGEVDSLSVAQVGRLLELPHLLQAVVQCEEPGDDVALAAGREMLEAARLGQLAEIRLEFERARELNEAALLATKPGQLPALRATTHTRLASLAALRGDNEAKEAHLLASLDEAERSNSAGVLAMGWLQYAELLPVEQSDMAFELFVGRSHAARDRGAVSDRTRVILAYREGVLRLHRGQLDQAGALARDVMPLAEEVDNFVLPQLYALEAELAIRKGDLDEASRRASAAAEATADKLGAHHPDAIEALRNLASVQSWQGDEAAALVTLDEAMKRQAVWGDEPSLTLVRILDARGTALYNLRRFSEAAETLETVRQMATELDGAQTWRDSAEVSLARAQVALERPEEAAVLIEGFLAREGGEDVYARSLRADAGILYATVLMELGRPQEAVASLPRVQGWVEAAFGDEGIDRVQAAVELADVWIQSGDPDSALRELERFLPLLRDEPMWRGKVQRAKAAALRDQGRLDEARDWARRSLASFEASTAGETEYHLIRALLADLGIGEAPGVQ